MSWWRRLIGRAGPVASAPAGVDWGDWGRLAAAFAELERTGAAVGATLVECLRRHDLEVTWNGSHETRPFGTLRDWRKPLPTAP